MEILFRTGLVFAIFLLVGIGLFVGTLLLDMALVDTERSVVVFGRADRVGRTGASGRIILQVNRAPEKFEVILSDSQQELLTSWVLVGLPLRLEALVMPSGSFLVTGISTADEFISRRELNESRKSYLRKGVLTLFATLFLIVFSVFQLRRLRVFTLRSTPLSGS